MPFEPIQGRPLRFPPGRVEIHLGPDRLLEYKRLYALSSTDLAGLPKLRDRDFDGRAVSVSKRELDALNAALVRLHAPSPRDTGSVFEAQEQTRTRLIKRTLYLS